MLIHTYDAMDDGGEWKMGRIGLNKSNLYERATALGTASTLPRGGELDQVDTRSTITANEGMQETFQDAQYAQDVLSEALAKSAVEIKEIGDRFFAIETDYVDVIRFGLEV